VTAERRAREEAERLQTGLIRAHRLASLGTLSASASGGSIEALEREGGGARMRVELPSAT
jgi:C4-dicarboxylate-specific signal transduction histidine kinase